MASSIISRAAGDSVAPARCTTAMVSYCFGRSDTRAQLRDFFEVSADWITLYALDSLGRQTDADKLRNKLNTRTRKTPPWNS